MKSKKLRRIVLRSLLVSTLICAINMNIIANKATFSMFTSSAQSSATMKTADAGDLIKEFNIVEEYGQQFIVIEPGEFLKDNSIVYFEVSGEAAAYITQLNPVALSKDKTPMNSKTMKWNSKSVGLSISKNKQHFISNNGKFYIPIYVNVNILQKLSFSSKSEFKGNITLRYLNGFINETKSIALSSSYLNSRWASGTDCNFWENVKNTLSNTNTLLVNEFQDEFNKNFQNESRKAFNIALDNEQIEVIDTIADGYRKHVSDLEIKNKVLLKQLEDLKVEKEDLINEINILIKKSGGSSKELQSQIDDLKSQNKQLESTIDGLRGTINSNAKETTNKPKENGTVNVIPAPAISNGSEKVEGSAVIISGTVNKVIEVVVISGTENKVIDSAATNDTGNEKNEE